MYLLPLLRPHLKPIFQAIAAKVDGEPCCDWVGETGAGHYVKMVHNGIEYGDMQMICEAYQVLKDALGLTADELGDIFTEWNKGELDSYLIEITRDILKFKDVDGAPLVEKIKDTAGQVLYLSPLVCCTRVQVHPHFHLHLPILQVHTFASCPLPHPDRVTSMKIHQISRPEGEKKKIHSTNTTTSQQNKPKCSFEILILTVSPFHV